MASPASSNTSTKPASRKPPGVPASAFELGQMIGTQQRESAGTGRVMQPVPAGAAAQGDGTGTALPPIGSKAKPAPLDPDKCRVLKGRPLPVAVRGDSRAQSRAKQLLDRMGPGDSVDLSKRHAHGVAAFAKKNKIKIALRKLGEDLYGIWRLPV